MSRSSGIVTTSKQDAERVGSSRADEREISQGALSRLAPVAGLSDVPVRSQRSPLGRGRLAGRALKGSAATFVGVFGIGVVGCCAAGLPVAFALGVSGAAALAAGAGVLAVALLAAGMASAVAAVWRKRRACDDACGSTSLDAVASGLGSAGVGEVDRGRADVSVAGGLR